MATSFRCIILTPGHTDLVAVLINDLSLLTHKHLHSVMEHLILGVGSRGHQHSRESDFSTRRGFMHEMAHAPENIAHKLQ